MAPLALSRLHRHRRASVLAAQAMGADFAYIGSAFIATEEARASDAYKQAIVDNDSDDIVYSNLFTGVHGNYLAPSIRNAGLDPANLPESDPSKMNFGGAISQGLERHLGLRAGHRRRRRKCNLHGDVRGAAQAGIRRCQGRTADAQLRLIFKHLVHWRPRYMREALFL